MKRKKRQTVSRPSKFVALLVTWTLALSSAPVSANGKRTSAPDCSTPSAVEAANAAGFLCPAQLPDVEEIRQVCVGGCYLFAVEDAAAAVTNGELALEVPKLKLHLFDALANGDVVQGERDEQTDRLLDCVDLSEAQAGLVGRLRSELATRPTWVTVGLVALGALGAGTLAGLIAR